MALKLQTIICSTRPGRVGPAVAAWFQGFAAAHGKFDVELVDLASFNLPIYDEPEHPTKQSYHHEHTKKWAASVKSADAFVFVMPEYNYGPPPALVNALNYVFLEWNYAPAGFVSYGGVSGGLRAVQNVKLLVSTLKMVPMTEGVGIPMVATLLDQDRKFTSNNLIDAGATTMLNEMHRWAEALVPLRAQRK
ncbi:MAG: NAD(P)H-dependent oxidoreductase [Alphaproteobacteria bacterium]|nr:NAD(P)H-dependent oxidoreductase [Alphaproteobacteria bacterium]